MGDKTRGTPPDARRVDKAARNPYTTSKSNPQSPRAQRRFSKKIYAWVGAILLTILAIEYTTLPGNVSFIAGTSRLLGGTEWTDAAGHVLLFGLLTAFWYRALAPITTPRRALVLALTFCLLLGTITEGLQLIIPERGASLLDLFANWTGPLIVTFAYRRTRTTAR